MALLGISLIGALAARMMVYTGPLVNETALSYAKSYTLDLNQYDIDALTMQATISTATISAVSFTDGRPSTATVTIQGSAGNSALSAQYAGVNITISSNNPSIVPDSGVQLTLNGYSFSGFNFYDLNYASMSAYNLATLINLNSIFTATATGASFNIVYASASTKGSFANSWLVTTTTGAALTLNGNTSLSSTTFLGGQDSAKFVIGSCVYVAETNFSVGASSVATAKNITDMMATSTACTYGVVVATYNANTGVITATTSALGSATNLDLFTSTPTALSINGSTVYSTATMLNGADSAVLMGLSAITAPSHKFTTGLKVLYSSATGSTSPGSLINGTTYFAIPYDSNTIRLATTSAYAQGGIYYVPITTQSAAGRGTFTLTPLAYNTATSTASVQWMVSNDGVNFSSYTPTMNGILNGPMNYTVTTSSSAFWDFGELNYRYLKAVVNAPGNGGINIVITGNGKSNVIKR